MRASYFTIIKSLDYGVKIFVYKGERIFEMVRQCVDMAGNEIEIV